MLLEKEIICVEQFFMHEKEIGPYDALAMTVQSFMVSEKTFFYVCAWWQQIFSKQSKISVRNQCCL